ncbi:hypothetical protein Tco_0808532 [Tanacetum coccineum]
MVQGMVFGMVFGQGKLGKMPVQNAYNATKLFLFDATRPIVDEEFQDVKEYISMLFAREDVIQKKVIREKDMIDLEADIPKKSASGKDVQCCSCHQNNNDEVQAVVDRSAYQLCDKYAKKLLPVFTVLRPSDDPEILDSIRLGVTPIKMDTGATCA